MVEGNIVLDPDDGVLIYQQLLGERPEVGLLIDPFSADRDPCGQPWPASGCSPSARRVGAQMSAAAQAELAGTAECANAGDHVVPRPHVCDVGTDIDYHACRFVPNDERELLREASVDNAQIAMADPRGCRGDHHLAFARDVERRVLDKKPLSQASQDSRFHDQLQALTVRRVSGLGWRNGDLLAGASR
jgi:hypothetical protein